MNCQPSGGTFTVTRGGISTAPLPHDASDEDFQRAIRALGQSLDPRSLAQRLALQETATVELGTFAAGFEGLDEAQVWEAISQAINEGWIDLWRDVAPQPLLSLSRAAADALELELTQDSTRWVRRAAAEKFSPHMHRLDWEEISELKEDDRPDPRALEPWEIAAANEEWERQGGEMLTDGRRAPRNWHFLGLRVQWPVVGLKAVSIDETTRYCPLHGRKLGWNHYCLACDQSGVDAVLPRVTTSRRRSHKKGLLRGGVGAA